MITPVLPNLQSCLRKFGLSGKAVKGLILHDDLEKCWRKFWNLWLDSRSLRFKQSTREKAKLSLDFFRNCPQCTGNSLWECRKKFLGYRRVVTGCGQEGMIFSVITSWDHQNTFWWNPALEASISIFKACLLLAVGASRINMLWCLPSGENGLKSSKEGLWETKTENQHDIK